MRTQLSLLALAAVMAVVCTPALRAQTQPALPQLEGFPAVGMPAVVTLQSAGAAPRQPLRYRIAAGYKDTMTTSMAMSMAMTVGEFAAPPTELPVMKTTADLAVSNLAGNGDITYDLAFTGMTAEPGAGIDPALVALMEKSAAGITTVKGTVTISDRGVNREARLDTDKVADPTLRQALDSLTTSIQSMSTPLPEEPVGVGARWEVRQAMLSGGTAMFQTGVYELMSIDGAAVTLRVTLTQSAPPQTVNNPALPPGASMEVEKITGSGSGTMTLRLDGLVPTGELSSTTQGLMNMTMGGQTQRMTVDTKIRMTVGTQK